MGERSELLRRSPSKTYGSVSRQGQHGTGDEDERDYDRPVRCLCTRRDCILVSVVSVLVVAGIITSLAVGVPRILEKQLREQQQGNLPPPPPPVLLPGDAATTSSAATTPALANTLAASSSSPSSPNSPAARLLMASSSNTALLNDTAASGPAVTPPVQRAAVFKRAAVAADDARCAQIGSSILRRNGSAVDAAIGATICLEATNPQHSGIGGGFFMTIYSKELKEGYVIDAREVAPSGANESMYAANPSLSATGGLSVAVPGAVRGFWEAHQQFGRLAWRDLFAPTIELCREGARVTETLASALLLVRDNILGEESLREIFVNDETGDLLRKGDVLKRPGLAATLETVATEGPDAFYGGSLAEKLVADVRAKGGILTADDLRSYTVRHRPPLLFPVAPALRGMSVPPPGSGALVALMLHVMAGYENGTPAFDVLDAHRLVESFKFAYAQRTRLGDADFVNVTELVQNLTSQAFADAVRKMTHDNATFDPSYYGPAGVPSSDHGTSQVTVVAPNGDAVSVTNTINRRFGAMFRSRSLDIILNDEMDDFAFPEFTGSFVNPPPPSTANFVRPGKRPLSSMAPIVLVDEQGDAALVIGGAGGSAITTSLCNVLVRVLYAGENLNSAMSAPRLHHKLYPNVLYAEPSLPAVFVDGLSRRGHNISFSPPPTHLNAILKQSDGTYLAVSDDRLDSGTAGF